jgi:hypothetical protein
MKIAILSLGVLSTLVGSVSGLGKGETCKLYQYGADKLAKFKPDGDACDDGLNCIITIDPDTGDLLPGKCDVEKCAGLSEPDLADDLDDTDANEATVRTTICHRTCSAKNPWVRITIDDTAWDDIHDCVDGGHKREHNITIDCRQKIEKKMSSDGLTFEEARTAIWGHNDADYLIKYHGTRNAVREKYGWSVKTAGKKVMRSKAEKDYWGYWERACPYVRHGSCCGTEELGACCGDEPYLGASIELTKYSCPANTPCTASNIAADCEDDLLGGVANAAAKYCYKIHNTGTWNLCEIDMTDPEWMANNPASNVPGCLSGGGVAYVGYSNGITFPDGSITDETATVSGTVADGNNQVLSAGGKVYDSDPSRLTGAPAASISIEKTANYDEATGTCNTGKEYVSGTAGRKVHYCYEVVNTGGTYLDDVTITDECQGDMSGTCEALAPGGSCRIPYNVPGGIPVGGESTNCPGVVKANPVDENKNDISYLDDVTDKDPAGLLEAENDTECSVVMSDPETLANGNTRVTMTETCVTCNCV